MKKINYYRLFIYLILLNSFVSLTNSFYPSNLSLGKIIGAMIIIVLFAIYIKNLKRKDIYFFMFIIIFDVMQLFRLEDISVDLENIIFFTSTTMILWKFSEIDIRMKLKSEFEKISNTIFIITNFLLAVVIFSLFSNSSWVIVNGQRIFMGFCDSGHKMAGNLCFISSIYFLYFINKKIRIRDMIYFAIIFSIILLTGSRTYLMSYSVIIILLYIKKMRKNNFIKLLSPFIMLIGIYLFINSSIFARFFIMGQNQYVSNNFWEATSSGRLIWWKIDLETFGNFDFIHKIVGKGFTYLYHLNLIEYGLKISAHNDFITLLISSGIYGIIGYIIILKQWFFKKDENKKFNAISIIITILMYMINAMISGVFGAQQYVFCNLIISLVLLNNNSNKKEKIKNEI
ncbi:MAG: O-antigen ligase family protein [Clostridia bacterium]|jgi:membrane protein